MAETPNFSPGGMIWAPEPQPEPLLHGLYWHDQHNGYSITLDGSGWSGLIHGDDDLIETRCLATRLRAVADRIDRAIEAAAMGAER